MFFQTNPTGWGSCDQLKAGLTRIWWSVRWATNSISFRPKTSILVKSSKSDILRTTPKLGVSLSYLLRKTIKQAVSKVPSETIGMFNLFTFKPKRASQPLTKAQLTHVSVEFFSPEASFYHPQQDEGVQQPAAVNEQGVVVVSPSGTEPREILPDNEYPRKKLRHGSKRVSNAQHPYHCPICRQTFDRQYSLQRHVGLHKGEKKNTSKSKVIPEHLHNQPWSPIFHFHCTSNCAVDQDSFKVFSWKTTLKVFGTFLPRDFLPNQRVWGWQYGRSGWGVIKVFVLADTKCTK